jgi:DNA-nicking Smr family endonuclease
VRRYTREWHEARQAEFAANRGKVRQLRERRDALNQAVVEATRANDPHLAAQLRWEARGVGLEIKALERRISDSASAAYNARHAPGGVHVLAKLDLHGQTVPGALAKLERGWPALAAMPGVYNVPCLLPIVTGRGRHSVGGEAKVRAAVLDWLSARGYEYELSEDKGSVNVHLPWCPAPAVGRAP